ncbi:MAG: dynamin family protein [Alphaproteobacteria bacterium]
MGAGADKSEILRSARDAVAPLADRLPPAAAALDVLQRDLLPRSAGADAYLVAGIVGPNNAGKSALFNALAGRVLSPSLPTGGATRRLVGVLHPSLLGELRAEPTLARFRLEPLAAAGGDAPLGATVDPSVLLYEEESSLPRGLMLIDTPDFDSILEDNRLASESLLTVADLVVAVVTRHSYQNKAVVTFLERWLQHGRPWMLVYNEASDADVARSHVEKLAADVGTSPIASFWAPHSLEVQRGTAPLSPVAIEGGRKLRDVLFDVDEIAWVKKQAVDAAMARLDDALRETSSALSIDTSRSAAVLQAAETRGFDAGMRIASAAMPARPFVDAFRAVLDRRSNPLSRSWRTTLRRIRVGIESVPALLRGGTQASKEQPAATLGSIERDELRRAWPSFWEEVVRDLGREARHPARQGASPDVVASLDRDLDDGRRAAAEAVAVEGLAMQDAEVAEFQQACEQLVEKAIEARGFDIDIQAAADLATLVPIALAAAVIVTTGGFGSDLAAVGGGVVGTVMFEKYAHVLGAGIMSEARRRWTEVRGHQLARHLVDAALPETAARIRTRVEEDGRVASDLDRLRRELRV